MRSVIKYAAVIILVWVTATQAQTDKLIYDQLVRPDGVSYYHLPIGLCEDYPEETTTPEILRTDLEFLKKHDVKFMRISFGWDAIESKPNEYDWLFWDDFVKMAVEEYQITLVPYICYTPQWISKGKTDTLYFWNYPAEDFQQFGKFMEKIVSRYKNYIKTWELWNEPDIWIYWQGSTEEFAEFVKVGSGAVRKADPEAKVVLGGIAYKPEFIQDLFKYHDVSRHVDIVNIHNYFETWHRHPVESIMDYVNEVYDVVWRFGDNQPIWMAEVGYSTFRKGSEVSTSYSAYYDYEHTPEYQAVDLIKRMTLVMATDKLSAVTWYELKDLPPSEDVIGDNNNNRFLGVAYADHTPKPAAKALQFFNQLFSKEVKCIDREVKVTKPAGSNAHVHSFETRNGDVILVSWVQTSVPGERGEDKSGMVKDTRVEKISITVPGKRNGKVKMYNELGVESEYAGVQSSGNSVIVPDLELAGGKVVILKIEK